MLCNLITQFILLSCVLICLYYCNGVVSLEENGTTVAVGLLAGLNSSTTATPPPLLDKLDIESLLSHCPRGNDTQLNKCFPIIIQSLQPFLPQGIPSLNIPPLDPFLMDEFEFIYGNNPLIIKSKLTNATVRHLTEFDKAEITIDTGKRILSTEFKIPLIRMSGNYELSGNIFFFEVGGSGGFQFEVGGIQAKTTSKLKLINQNGTKIFQSDGEIQLDLKVKDININLMNLFNGNAILGPIINNVLNDNAQELFNEIKQPLSKQIAGIIVSISDGVASKMGFLTDGVD